MCDSLWVSSENIACAFPSAFYVPGQFQEQAVCLDSISSCKGFGRYQTDHPAETDTLALTIPVCPGKASKAPCHCSVASAVGLSEPGRCEERSHGGKFAACLLETELNKFPGSSCFLFSPQPTKALFASQQPCSWLSCVTCWQSPGPLPPQGPVSSTQLNRLERAVREMKCCCLDAHELALQRARVLLLWPLGVKDSCQKLCFSFVKDLNYPPYILNNRKNT